MRAKKFGLKQALLSFGLMALLALAESAAAQTEKVIYRFAGTGLSPSGSLLYRQGNLYGLAAGAGTCNGVSSACGVIFELTPNSSGIWSRKVIHTFGGNDGQEPGSLILDAAGNLYGSTYLGGAYNAGTIFELIPTASGLTEQILYTFTGGSDGKYPNNLLLDNSGNLYGIAAGGIYNQELVFELTHTASGWSENTLYSFNTADGTEPSPLAIDGDGNLYGAAPNGGHDYNRKDGTVYELSPSAGGAWTATVIFAFRGVRLTGTYPVYGVLIDPSGNLYGMAVGNSYPAVGGFVFELIAPTWIENGLWGFNSNRYAGAEDAPSGPLTLDVLGNVYGEVYNGDSNSVHYAYDGYVFRAGPSGTASYVFPALAPPDRYYPSGGLAVDGLGNVYGTTSSQNIFEITF